MSFIEKFEISISCPKCNGYQSVFVERMDFYKWMRSKNKTSQIFSYLSNKEINFLDTGICDNCLMNCDI